MKAILITFIVVLALFACSDDDTVLTVTEHDTVSVTDTISITKTDSFVQYVDSASLSQIADYIDSLEQRYGSLDGYNTESVSYKSIYKRSARNHEIVLRDDGSNFSSKWRYWWYTPLFVSPNETDTIIISNRGWSTFYVPVYSYDQKKWHYFDDADVTVTSNNRVQIIHPFDQKEVWVARFYPYTLKDLNSYVSSIIDNENVAITVEGFTSDKNPIIKIEVTDFSVNDSEKEIVFLHARTHPAETGQSFVLEGFVSSLLQNYAYKLDSTLFVIVPMYNVDGVVSGNTRTDTDGINLEENWIMNVADSFYLDSSAQIETRVLRNVFASYNKHNIKVALNLHCSNSEPDVAPFFFLHFGPDSLVYSNNEIALFSKMNTFYSIMDSISVYDILKISSGSSFTSSKYPETWWWENYQDQVMAMTFETTYSKCGTDNWIDVGAMKSIGVDLASTVFAYLR